MSQSLLDSSGSRSSASTASSPQASYSDTTPSPSGGNISPSFNPHDLTSKLAFLEASESLAQVAETLSLAAKAMSKAAASFAVASGYKDRTYNKTSHHYEGRSMDRQASPGGTESPEWQQNSYALPSLVHMSENGNLSDTCPQHNAVHEHTSADFLDSFESTSSTITSRANATAPCGAPLSTEHYELEPVECPTPTTNPERQPTNGFIPGNNGDISCPTATCLPSNAASENSLGGQQAHEHPAGRLRGSDIIPTNPSRIPLEPANEVAPLISMSEPQSSAGPPQRLSQRIVLDSGFDQLPVICALAKQNPKMICLFKYWGVAPSVISAILKKSVSQAVIYPTATKAAALQTTLQEFASLSTGILIWPALKSLPGGPSSTVLREVHLLHLGEPSKETKDCSGSSVTVVTTPKELSEMTASARDKLIQEYPLDCDNEAYNQQGSGSLLHLARAYARVRLCKNPSARGIYLPWLGFQRKNHPEWTAEELAKRANDYAEEFLLRGEPKTDRLIGGRIPLTPSEIKSMSLQSAVDAGILVVA